MSHIVTIETEIRDASALKAACHRLGLQQPARETTQLFSGEATGYCVRLPDWRYPVVCNTETGHIQFDNFEGRWGERRELDRLMQAYACDKAKLEARRRGHSVSEQPLADGSIKLTVRIGNRMKTIELIISPSGESRVETKGFAGSECRDASRFLESTLGTTTSETMTAEFHDAQVHQQDRLAVGDRSLG